MCMYTLYLVFTLVLHNEHKFVQSVFSGLDWTVLTSDPLSRTGLDQDHRLTDLDWTGFFQMNPFHTLIDIASRPPDRAVTGPATAASCEFEAGAATATAPVAAAADCRTASIAS